MRFLFLLLPLCLFLFAACDQEANTTTTEADYAENAEELDAEAAEDWEGPYVRESGPAVIVGSRVNVRTEAQIGAPRLTQLNEGHQVKILSVSPQRLTVTGQEGTCEAFPWVEVEFGGNESGWVYGKYVGWKIPFKDYASVSDSSFEMAGISYHLAFYRNFQFGFTDEYGLSGCEDFVTVAFVENDLGIIHFPIFQMENANGEGDERWIVESSEWAVETVEEIVSLGESARVGMYAEYQEGESHYDVLLDYDGDEGNYYAFVTERKVEYPD